jgi:hypothetical protein
MLAATKSIDLMTCCTLSWLPDLRRFLHFQRLAMPTARLHVALVYANADEFKPACRVADRLTQYCKSVVVTKQQHQAGRLLYYDRLRAKMPGLFKLQEGLYMDVDVDILKDLAGFPDLAPNATVVGVKDVVIMQGMREGLAQLSLREPRGVCAIGFMYLRKNFLEEFDHVVDEGKFDIAGHFAPGSVIWNHLIDMDPTSYYAEPDWHCTLYDARYLYRAAALHFSGATKNFLRPYWKYESMVPRKYCLTQEVEQFPDIDIEPREQDG